MRTAFWLLVAKEFPEDSPIPAEDIHPQAPVNSEFHLYSHKQIHSGRISRSLDSIIQYYALPNPAEMCNFAAASSLRPDMQTWISPQTSAQIRCLQSGSNVRVLPCQAKANCIQAGRAVVTVGEGSVRNGVAEWPQRLHTLHAGSKCFC